MAKASKNAVSDEDFEIQKAPKYKVLINIGATLDIPTGSYQTGKYGESILNGGLGAITADCAIGNEGKTTLLNYMMFAAARCFASCDKLNVHTYDTEVNAHEERVVHLSKQFPEFKDRDLIDEGKLSLTDRTIYSGNEWFELLKKRCRYKISKPNEYLIETPFLDRDGSPFKMHVPSFNLLDSLTDFQTDASLEMMDETEIGDSQANMLNARGGLHKSRFLTELPAVVYPASHYILMTAQVGKDLVIPTGPIPKQPDRKLSNLRNGDKLTGVSAKFFYAMSNCWHLIKSEPLWDKDRQEEYPKKNTIQTPGSRDLLLVTVRQLRSKSGPTGYTLDLIVSQRDGVQPTLTEFHYLRDKGKYFGTSGGTSTYSLDIYPSVKLSRPTIRTLIEDDSKLRRAINITSELLQLREFKFNEYAPFLCTAKELYEDLIAMGYDWDVLLNTRGYWTANNDKQEIPFLSTMDLLHMRLGMYKPYWLKS